MAITLDKLQHILGVARYMYQQALSDGKSEEYAQEMFVLGFVHDIGYEFDDSGRSHHHVGGKILNRMNFKYAQEVTTHGLPDCLGFSEEAMRLNAADMRIMPGGDEVTLEERVADITTRYGEGSVQALCAAEMARRLM